MSAKKTRMSGALHGDGDIHVDEILCLDGKVHGKCTNVSVSAAELKKIQQQAAKIGQVGAIVTPVIDGYGEKAEIYLTMRISDLEDIISHHVAEARALDEID